MEYIYNVDNKSQCWYKDICDKSKCGNHFCIRHYKMDSLTHMATMEGKQKYPIQLKLDADGVDRNSYTELKNIQLNIQDFVNQGKNLLVYSERTGNGKAQPLDSLVLTSSGYKMLKDLKWGESIYGEDGKLHKVISTFFRGTKSVYRVKFSDNTYTLCCDEHLWNIRKKGTSVYKTVELKEILNYTLHKKGQGNQWFIPITSPLEFEAQDVKINPYVLGCLLGDGTLYKDGSIVFTNTEEDVINRFSELLPSSVELRKRGEGIEYYIANKINDYQFKVNEIKQYLRDYNLIGTRSYDKFIPREYLFNSIENRVLLLQGLIDTDGSISNKSSNIEYTTVSEQLVKDITFVVQSLGGVITISERLPKYTYKGIVKQGRKSYKCLIRMPKGVEIFSSKKHRSKFNYNQQHNPIRAIKSIDYIGEQDVMCIKTSNPTELYLTNDCIVTHNTEWSKKLLLSWFDSIWPYTELECRGLFISMPRFINSMKENISNPNEYYQYINDNILKADLVVWDEINYKEYTTFEHDYLLSVISQRLAEGKSNIYTTNYSLPIIEQKLGTRLSSRIIGSSIKVEFKGKDKRSWGI